MDALPTLEEITTWTDEEVEAALELLLPPEWSFKVSETHEVWSVTILDAEGAVVFVDCFPDRRMNLLNGYGFLWLRLYKPVNPNWVRRRDELRGPARRGFMHLPGSENLPDPEDFDPASVYDLDPTGRPK